MATKLLVSRVETSCQTHPLRARSAVKLASWLLASLAFGCAGEGGEADLDEELGSNSQALEVPIEGVVLVSGNPVELTPPVNTNITVTNGPSVQVTMTPGQPVDVNQPAGTLNINAPTAPIKVARVYGQLLCSETKISKGCGTEHADYVGAYQLDTTCDSGFYDMQYGGTCWKCPDNDGQGEWIRTLDAVTKDSACHRSKGYGLLDTAPATLLSFNGCPKPNAAAMGLLGKRTPGNPFLDIAGGWSEGSISSGCYACPVADKDGNILITDRNTNPVYGDNQACNVLFKYRPAAFADPGLGGIAGVQQLMLEGLLEPNSLNGKLAVLAQAKGFAKDSSAAKTWIAQQWQEIARDPYINESMRALVFLELVNIAKLPDGQRSTAQKAALNAFETYLNARRVYIAQLGLEMYDAWKSKTDADNQITAKSQLMVAFDYGDLPFDFHRTLSTTMAMGAVGGGTIGAVAAALAFTQAAEATGYGLHSLGAAGEVWIAPLNLLKGTAVANSALAGAAAITAAFAIIQGVAIDQFIEIVTARPKLEAALAYAQTPVTILALAGSDSDQLLYWWAKAMEQETHAPANVISIAAQAAEQARQRNYAPLSELAAKQLSVLDAGFYVNKYPDLKAAFGTNVPAAQDHWLKFGISEGRDASKTFSIGGYLAHNPDLNQADYAGAMQHWIDWGKAEKRNTSAEGTYMADPRAAALDPTFYFKKYPDLQTAFGFKVPRLTQHWLEHGLREGRLPNATVSK